MPHMKSPQFHKVLHAVRDLYLSLVGYVDKNNDEEKMSKGESGGKGKKVAQTVGKTLNTARKEAEVSRLGKLMEEQARSRAADQKRIERKASEQTRAQKAHADKHKREKGLKEKPGKSNPKQVGATPHLSEAERKALRLIKAAQEQEAKKLEQAEKDQKERLSRLAAEKEKAGGPVEEDKTDDALANAIEEALEDLSPHTPPTNKKPVKTTQKESTGTKRPATESATEGADDRIPPPPAKKQKRATTKGRARPVVEDSSEESDNVKAHKASTKANKMKTPKKIPRPKVSIADHLAAKAAARAD
ncbi:hypothetical protein N0V95_009723 [Ascochyta clinopodiicola]|nr:hypothetical protein N0V95_009723 [Ascochyta clinopodiicola]